jgi:hypothetical protein
VRRRLIIAALALVVLGCPATTIANASPHKVYVERDIVGQELAYRPHAIGLSADGTFTVIGISYQSYGGPLATATGQAYVRGCTPNCAEGKEYRPTATLRLSDQIQCRGVTIYSRLRYVLNGPLPPEFRRRGIEPLRPVGEKGCRATRGRRRGAGVDAAQPR